MYTGLSFLANGHVVVFGVSRRYVSPFCLSFKDNLRTKTIIQKKTEYETKANADGWLDLHARNPLPISNSFII